MKCVLSFIQASQRDSQPASTHRRCSSARVLLERPSSARSFKRSTATPICSTMKSDQVVQRRGAFIVLEGLDRSGKSTQVINLVAHLKERGHKAESARFPDRTTSIGKMIDGYLQSKQEMDDRAIHLLFSANRWERAREIAEQLEMGTTIVCDRYAFSGIAFSAAKGIPYEWCRAPDVGLLTPDLVCFLNVDSDTAESRGGFGQERYETRDIQNRVRKVFEDIQGNETGLNWHTVDASESKENVAKAIQGAAMECLERISGPTQWTLFHK